MHFGKRPTVFAVLLLSLCFLGFGHRTLAMDFTERQERIFLRRTLWKQPPGRPGDGLPCG
jgi:hypothetical protein